MGEAAVRPHLFHLRSSSANDWKQVVKENHQLRGRLANPNQQQQGQHEKERKRKKKQEHIKDDKFVLIFYTLVKSAECYVRS